MALQAMALAAAVSTPVWEEVVVGMEVVGAGEEAVGAAGEAVVAAIDKSCTLYNGSTGFHHDNHVCVCSFLKPEAAYAADF